MLDPLALANLAAAMANSSRPSPTSSEHQATVLRVDGSGTCWVRIPGGAEETPVGTSLVDAAPGDVVQVAISSGRAVMTGNVSSPSASSRSVSEVERLSSEAVERALDASVSASAAAADATLARRSAQSAVEDARTSFEAAASARSSAASALAQLSVVQDVAGTLSWISSHGTFSPATDVEVVPSTVYFEPVDGEYVPVAEPKGSPAGSGWYVLEVGQSAADYVMSHLAVTSAGLWVLPSGLGQAASAQAAPGYKMLLSSSGAFLYDDRGDLVSTFGESVAFDSSRPQYVGGEHAYVAYYDSDGDGVADSLRIGGERVSIGGRPLSSLLDDVSSASEAAEEAARVARDSAVLSISSTRGQIFRKGEERTTLRLTVYPAGGGALDAIGDVRARFGANAYVEWRATRDADGGEEAIGPDDPRLSHGGMWLDVSPSDVTGKTTFSASLVVPGEG